MSDCDQIVTDISVARCLGNKLFARQTTDDTGRTFWWRNRCLDDTPFEDTKMADHGEAWWW